LKFQGHSIPDTGKDDFYTCPYNTNAGQRQVKALFLLTAIIDRNGNAITIDRDCDGFPLRINQASLSAGGDQGRPDGCRVGERVQNLTVHRTVNVMRNPGGDTISQISPPGGLASIVYKYIIGNRGRSKLFTVTRGDQTTTIQTTTYEYYPSQPGSALRQSVTRLKSVLNPNQYMTKFTYQLCAVQGFVSLPSTIQFAREQGDNPQTFDVTSYSCESGGTVDVTDPNLHVTHYKLGTDTALASFGLPVEITDDCRCPGNRVITLEYDVNTLDIIGRTNKLLDTQLVTDDFGRLDTATKVFQTETANGTIRDEALVVEFEYDDLFDPVLGGAWAVTPFCRQRSRPLGLAVVILVVLHMT
jgi:hypothetical protein